MIQINSIGLTKLNQLQTVTSMLPQKKTTVIQSTTRAGTMASETERIKNEAAMMGREDASVAISQDGDVVEISRQGIDQSQHVATWVQASEGSEEAEVAEESNILTNYSPYELSQMLTEGKITPAEYYAEIDRREALKNMH